MNNNRLRETKIFFFSVLCFILVAIISIGVTAHADEPEETLPVNISVDIHWDIDGGTNIRKGQFRMNAKSTLNLDRTGSGLDHNPKLTPLTLKYRGRSFTGSFHFEETLTQKQPQPPQCPPLTESYSGSGGFSYSPPEEYDSINLLFRRFDIAKSLIKGVSGVGAQQFLAQLQSQMDIPPSYYEFMAGGISGKHTIPGKKRKIKNGQCYYEQAEKQVYMSVIGLRFPIPEEGPMEGKQTWHAKLDGPPRNFSIKLSQTGVGKEKPFRPENVGTGGNATYSISWSFKEVSPELRILVKKEDAWKDITGESEEEICVGQKVLLKCEVLPEGGDSVSSARWQIPGVPELVIKDWEVTKKGTQKTLFTEGDCHDQTVEFAWIDGSFQGQEQKIMCAAQVKGKTLTADTTFKVYKPKAEVKINAGKEIKVAIPPNVDSKDCELYPDSPSIKIESKVTMPNTFKDQEFVAFYVQLVESEAWGLSKVGFPKYEWLNDIHKPMLDTSFPYMPEKKGVDCLMVTMDDTPGFPLSSMASAYVHMQFQTYLMFKPPKPKSGRGITSVPLKRVDWKWTAAAVAIGESYPSEIPLCGKGHKVIYNKAPSKYEHSASDSNQYPEWKDTKNKGKPKSTREMTTNREDLPPEGKKTMIDWTKDI
jgi:hypothetical protein